MGLRFWQPPLTSSHLLNLLHGRHQTPLRLRRPTGYNHTMASTPARRAVSLPIAKGMSTPRDPDEPSLLSTLPPELRNAIYDCLFLKDDPIIIVDADDTSVWWMRRVQSTKSKIKTRLRTSLSKHLIETYRLPYLGLVDKLLVLGSQERLTYALTSTSQLCSITKLQVCSIALIDSSHP